MLPVVADFLLELNLRERGIFVVVTSFNACAHLPAFACSTRTKSAALGSAITASARAPDGSIGLERVSEADV